MSASAVRSPQRLARTLMVQGTASGVGKSWLVTALCRALRRRGCRVAPFKAQNMSNNAAVTARGGEVGRAQAVQAEAAGIDIDERMNPVLLKPIADDRSDVVVLGASRPELAKIPWLERRAVLWPEVVCSLDSLRADFDWVVIEGAGSPAEVNLASADIVNMAVARHAGAPVLLVADIDRGGAFASLVGTWQLLPSEDRARIVGFVLNRFRGDPTLLGEAPEVVRRHTGVPVVGVVPWVHVRLPEEDAAPIERTACDGGAEIGVVRLPRIANFDDILPLEREEGLRVRWVEQPEELAGLRALVIPGSRNVGGDLAWMRSIGLDRAIRGAAAAGMPVLGLCGGMQMLGEPVEDPYAIEGGGRHAGLCLLPVDTVLDGAKTVTRVRARWSASEIAAGELIGYEIHHGRTEPRFAATPRHQVRDRAAVGAEPSTEQPSTEHGMAFQTLMTDAAEPQRVLGYRRGAVWGTYVHGCLADDAFRRAWLALAGLAGRPRVEPTCDPIDVVTDAVESALDLDALFALAAPRP